ncbi:MAG: hypothetical protein OHM56_05145 [Spiroplasma phoeniceum]|nr:MAG: hypothetical protein OHM57_04550 [Spiroplasma phoeniceum]UZQ33313.1 MAG: hypothetical protein OHM56_05145 [Spiroplasma phoeniceum]
MSANIYSFYNDAFWGDNSKGKGYLPFEIFREQGNDKVGAIFGANAASLGFTTLLTDKCKGTVLTKNGLPTHEIVYSTYNLKQLNEKTNRVYLINEQTKAVDAQTPVSDSEEDNDCEFLQTLDGTNCSYIIDMFSIQALYKGNFEIIFYADNPYTNNEEDYLKLSVWSFRGKTKSTLNNYLRDMTTNYKTSFLLPHYYEIPTFNYPKYVLPPVPYNYQPYTKDIWDANTIQPLKTKIIAPAQCTATISFIWKKDWINLFNNNYYDAYYETKINLRQIDPTIQSIDKFISSYKTIEISNLNNLQVSCFKPDIERFIKDRNINILGGYSTCENNLGWFSNGKLKFNGEAQKDDVNFDNTITLYTDNIKNDIQIFATAYTNGLPSDSYQNRYSLTKNCDLTFLLQTTKLSDNDDNKIKETYLQAYYTDDMKLKVIFTKVVRPDFSFYYSDMPVVRLYKYFGNDEDIIIDLNALGVLNMANNSDNPVQITMKPR